MASSTSVECPNCGNDDLDCMTACDRPNAIRSVRSITEDGKLLVSADYETEYDGSEKVQLFCCKCNTDFDPPLPIEYV